ncbi:MAG TPA: hypothetical protein VFK13_07905 [Gemmatimonadaceae bacterium]|nr:hypothetical protein [Gemmatimonadaceae bacterium]
MLVVAQNRLMYDYVALLWELVRDVAHVDGFATAPAELRQSCRALGLRVLSDVRARVAAFDYILLADHAPARFDPYARRIIVPHGPVRSRPVRGWSYYYDERRIFWADGRPVYDLMVDIGDEAVAEALARIPSYRGRIVAAGDLRTARLVTNAQRAPAECHPVVAIMSTWGPFGLLEQHATWLLPALADLAQQGRIEVVLSAHPNIWAGRRATRNWTDVLHSFGAADRVRVLSPEDDWTVHFARCNIAITDHTSLSASFAATGRPLLPVHVVPEQIGEGTFFEALIRTVPPLTQEQALIERLFALRESGMPHSWTETCRRFVPDQSAAERRLREAIGRLFRGENPVAAA